MRDTFLKALSENEDDATTRFIYADWLDEQGEHEEADRQRRWPAAKEWLVRFFDDHSSGDYYEQLNSFEELMALAQAAVKEGHEKGLYIDCFSNEGLCDALRANREEFWRNWSVVTGVPLPPGAESKSYFGCSC
jgi:uncharacterized protein (TIGR02996 family)